MKGHGTKFSRKKEAVIAALIEGATVKRASQVGGVGEATVYRWLGQAEFQSVYSHAKKQIVERAVTSLQLASEAAVRTLRDIMTDGNMPASSRVSSAKAILDMTFKGLELEDLSRRITEIERLMEEERR